MVGISAPVQQSNVENSFHTLFTLFTLFTSRDRLSHCFILNENLSLDTNVIIIQIVTIVLFLLIWFYWDHSPGCLLRPSIQMSLENPLKGSRGWAPWAGRERWWRLVGGRGSTICPAFQLFPTGNPKTVIHPKGYSVIAQILFTEINPNKAYFKQNFCS